MLGVGRDVEQLQNPDHKRDFIQAQLREDRRACNQQTRHCVPGNLSLHQRPKEAELSPSLAHSISRVILEGK